ncbi:metallophosphatase family protein [Puniceicoccaceae bacterium K14]|nr:metallophosphatase family protein [Puniceicoccaceae bacterium K14]
MASEAPANDSHALSIAVISDTHNTLPEIVSERIKHADEIWHLGDLSNEQVYRELSELGPQLQIVQGNTDPANRWPSRLMLNRYGHYFYLQHYPHSLSRTSKGNFLHGHLHIPIDERFEGGRILSPGAINGPRQGSLAGFAWIRFNHQKTWTWSREIIDF